MTSIKNIIISILFVSTAVAQEVMPLKEEPSYLNKPKYLQLVFGDGESEHVWLVLDGDKVLYADIDADGKIDAEIEKFEIGKNLKNSPDYFIIPKVMNRSGEVIAKNLTLIRYTRSESHAKEDIIKVMLPEEVPLINGWRRMFVNDWKKAKVIRFSSSVRPQYLRSKEISLSDESAEIHLCLSGERRNAELSGLVGIDAFPETEIPLATIHWPTSAKDSKPLTSQIHLNNRC